MKANNLRLIQVQGGDDAASAPINIQGEYTLDRIRDANWNISLLGEYIKPYVMLPDGTLVNLTAEVYSFEKYETAFVPGILYLSDKKKLIKAWAEAIKQSGKAGSSYVSMSKNVVGTKNMCIAVDATDEYETEVFNPRGRVGERFLIKGMPGIKSVFEDLVVGYDVYTQSAPNRTFHSEWDAYSGELTGEAGAVRRFEAQKQHKLPHIPASLAAHFARYKYGIVYRHAAAATRESDKKVLVSDCVLRLFPDENCRLTGKFCVDTSGHLYAQIELRQDAYTDVLGYSVKETDYYPLSLTGAALREECAKYGINSVAVIEREGVEIPDEPMYSTSSDIKRGKQNITILEAVQYGYLTAFVDDNGNAGKIDNDLTGFLKRYDYYKVALVEREAQLMNLLHELQATFGTSIRLKYGTTYYDFPLDWVAQGVWNIYYNGENRPRMTINGEEFSWWSVIDKGKELEELIIKAKGQEYFATTYQILKSPVYFINYYWDNVKYDEYYKTDKQLQDELRKTLMGIYTSETPFCDIDKIDKFLWIRATGAVGIEGMQVPITTKKANWAVNTIVVNSTTGMPEFSDDTAALSEDGGELIPNMTISTDTYEKQISEIERLNEQINLLQQEQEKKNSASLLIPLAAAFLMN